MANQIHPLAVVDPEAKLGDNNIIGPFCVIDKNVVIGDNNKLYNGVTLHFGTRLGNNNEIFPGASISTKPQDLKFQGEETTCEIGDNNSIRENVTISRGTASKGKTTVGNGNLLMENMHIGHDCEIGNGCIIGNSTKFAGEVVVDDNAIISACCLFHQFLHVGGYIMFQGGSRTSQDIPPYVIAGKEPIRYAGVNLVGLRRRGFARETIEAIHEAYFRDPSVFLYCVDPDQMDDVLSLPELADEGKEYTGKAMPFLALSCLATFDLKNATLTLASDYEELFSKISPSKLKHANKRVREFDPAMDVLMHHFGLIEMIEVPGLLKDLFQIEMSEKLCFSLMYFRLSIPKKYQTLTVLRDGRHFISEIGLDLNKIMPGMNVGEFLVPYFPPNQYQMEQWKRKGTYMDVYPGWSYLLGLLALHMGMKMEEAKDECDLYYQDVRNGATLNEMMNDLMGSNEGNRHLIPRMMIWECALHCVLGTALPGLKGANRIVTSQMSYFMKDASFVDDPVSAENIKPDTHIENMPEDLQRELGSRLFTLETTDLEPIKDIVNQFPDNIDLNYIYGVANERLGRLQEAISAFEKVDRLMEGKYALIRDIIKLCRDGKIRKPVSIHSDGTLIL